MNRRKYIIVGISILIPILSIALLIYAKLFSIEIHYDHYVTEGLRTLLIAIWILLLFEKFQSISLIGFLIIEMSFFFEAVYEFNASILPSFLQIFLIDFFMTVGLVIVAVGFLKERKRVFEILYTDSLTKLNNRRSFRIKVDDNIKKREPFGILILNFNNFRLVNNSYGYEYGDKVLIHLSQVIKQIFDDKTFIARSGNDEFLVILEEFKSKEEVDMLCNYLIFKFKEVQNIDGIQVHLPLSIGASFYPDDGKVRPALFRKAEDALRISKRPNMHRYNRYNADLQVSAGDEMYSKLKIIEALESDELIMHYQPILDIENNKITAGEALLRWKTENLLLDIEKTISTCEKYGLIHQLDYYVIKKVCEDISKYSFNNIRLGINISSITMSTVKAANKIIEIIDKYNVEPTKITLEITETALIENEKNVIDNLMLLHERGIRISLDDFGTGFSSLAHLSSLPIDSIKIDKTFTGGIFKSLNNETLTKQTLGIAKIMNLKTVAEGVETKEQLKFLADNKCNYAQGYMISKPISVNDFIDFSKTYNNV